MTFWQICVVAGILGFVGGFAEAMAAEAIEQFKDWRMRRRNRNELSQRTSRTPVRDPGHRPDEEAE
jgi:hypothetical protein